MYMIYDFFYEYYEDLYYNALRLQFYLSSYLFVSKIAYFKHINIIYYLTLVKTCIFLFDILNQ